MPGEGLAVIESLRNPDEVAALRQRKDFVLLALDAPVPVRLRRLAARGRAGDPMTPEELRRLDEREAADPSKSGIRIKECMALADVLIINDSTLAQLHLQIDDALRRAGKR
jgi:dephospho-CoA kinase